MIKILSLLIAAALFVGCSTRVSRPYSEPASYTTTNYNTTKNSHSKWTMRPYAVHGKRYYPTVVRVGERFKGRASWYGPNFHGKKTSNGEKYNMHAMTAAHKTLPMNTIVRVTNRDNGKSIVVRINDRGPFVNNRIIDLSKTAATKIGMITTGTAPVKLEILGFQGKDDRVISDSKTLQKGPKEKLVSSFSVQIGSFSRIEGAILTQEKHDNTQGYRTIIKDTEYNDKRLFRVWFQGFKSEEEARDFIASQTFEYAHVIRE